MMNDEERILAIKNLIKLYEVELAGIITTGPKFDLLRLPEVVQDATKLVIAKAPAFSNIGAVTTVNYVFTHLLGQLRPLINDNTYSPDSLRPNYYSILLSSSGSGKDSSYQTLMKACGTAFSLIEDTRIAQQEAKAIKRALYDKRKENPNATEADVEYNDYAHYIKEPLRTIVSGTSSRGGVASLLNKFQKEELGQIGLFMGEFALELKNGSMVSDVLQLAGELFDMGNSVGPEFKTEEVKEAPITSTYINFLGHTSPKVIFSDERVRSNLLSLFHTLLARRVWFTMPDAEESVENNIIPTTIKEARELADERSKTISRVSAKLDNITAEVVRRMLSNDAAKIITFHDTATSLYEDYFDYCARRAELMEDSSIQQLEMMGRAFKTGRLAAIWALLENTNEISRDVLASAIYFAEFNARYLDKFIRLMSAKSFIILGDIFKSGKMMEISLDNALSNGYITRVSKDFKELIDPINSYLRDAGVCTYNETTKIFKYEPFKQSKFDVDGYTISYTKVDGMPKKQREKFLENFEVVKTGSFKFLENIMSNDTIYNVFQYKEGLNKAGEMLENKRSQDNIISDTKLISIDVDESPVPLHVIHDYLEEYQHIVSTTSDKDNKYKFRILLPVNVAISGEDPKLYAYVVRRVSEELLIKPDTTCFNSAQPMYSYKGSEIFSVSKGALYDVTELIKEYMLGKEEGLKTAPTKARTAPERKKKIDNALANVNRIFSYVIEAKKGQGSLMMARASLHMIDLEFTREDYLSVINYINSLWQSPMNELRLNNTIIKQYIDRFED